MTYRCEDVQDLEVLKSGFRVKTSAEEFSGQRVIIATGHRDNIDLLDIEGLQEVYGRSIFPCPFCDGFEMADKKLAVIGDAEMAPRFAKTIAHWSKDVMVFTNGQAVKDPLVLEGLAKNEIKVIENKILRLKSVQGELTAIELMNGSIIERQGGFLPDTKSTESTDFAKKLNVATKMSHFGMEEYQVDDNKETNLKGLYIIGDARAGWTGVAAAVAEGSAVGAAITHQIIDENWIA